MLYEIHGAKLLINSMKKPEGSHGSNFEFEGNNSLKKIGLEPKFWFRAPFFFSNKGPIETVTYNNDPVNEQQWILSIFLLKSIKNGKLTDQFAFF